ncbi:hypothetical protein D3C72_1975560 [compost metagenome]
MGQEPFGFEGDPLIDVLLRGDADPSLRRTVQGSQGTSQHLGVDFRFSEFGIAGFDEPLEVMKGLLVPDVQALPRFQRLGLAVDLKQQGLKLKAQNACR